MHSREGTSRWRKELVMKRGREGEREKRRSRGRTGHSSGERFWTDAGIENTAAVNGV